MVKKRTMWNLPAGLHFPSEADIKEIQGGMPEDSGGVRGQLSSRLYCRFRPCRSSSLVN